MFCSMYSVSEISTVPYFLHGCQLKNATFWVLSDTGTCQFDVHFFGRSLQISSFAVTYSMFQKNWKPLFPKWRYAFQFFFRETMTENFMRRAWFEDLLQVERCCLICCSRCVQIQPNQFLGDIQDTFYYCRRFLRNKHTKSKCRWFVMSINERAMMSSDQCLSLCHPTRLLICDHSDPVYLRTSLCTVY